MMIKNILILLFLTFSLFAENESFSKSKQELREIYRDHQVTIYCDCKYNYKDKNNMIDKESCGYIPRIKITKKGKINQRANRIEWEHIIPAENFGRQFSCWRDGAPKCVKKDGKAYKVHMTEYPATKRGEHSATPERDIFCKVILA